MFLSISLYNQKKISYIKFLEETFDFLDKKFML